METVTANGEGFLLEARTLLNNALNDPDILAHLKAYAYDETRIGEGLSLLGTTETLILAQKKEYGEQYEATQDLETSWNAADKAYMKTLKIARIVFQNNPKGAAALMLLGERLESLTGWLEQALAFYQNLINDPDMVSAMSKFGYTADKLKAESAMVSDVSLKSQAQIKEKGEAQQATQDRDSKMKELDKWISDFRAVVKIALSDEPQKLEKLGIVVLNGPRRQKKLPVTPTTATAVK